MQGKAGALALMCAWCSACGTSGTTDGPTPGDLGAGPCAARGDCDDGRCCNGLELCAPASSAADARGCVPGEPPCRADLCDEARATCDGVDCPDLDGDGQEDVACGGLDCDDTRSGVFAGNVELCDAGRVDEDCDPETLGDRDLDGDGFVATACCNGDRCGTDCDDARASTSPIAGETCDGLDNDCDGSVDEGLLVDVFADRDRDLHGDPDAPLSACPGIPGVSASSLDCDDDDPFVNLPQPEFFDGVDNDCDGRVDEDPEAVTWYADLDGDRYGDPEGASTRASRVLEGFSLLANDCDDTTGAISPAAPERCNGRDDDCNGLADFAIGVNDFEDDDGDGIPDARCAGDAGDCDDRDPDVRPGAAERCNGRDDDCDADVDEDCDLAPGDMGPGAPAPLVNLALGLERLRRSEGETQTLVAQGERSDGSTGPVMATFESSDPALASVDAAGRVSALAVGDVVITARLEGLSATLSLTVDAGGFAVFDDALVAGARFSGFPLAVNDITVTGAEAFTGTSALRVVVPAEGFTGGTWLVDLPADVSAYDALTLWVKADRAGPRLDVAGVGEERMVSDRILERRGIPLTTEWQQAVVPLPSPARNDAQVGLFHLAEGASEGTYTLYVDEVRYVALDRARLTDQAARMDSLTSVAAVGDVVSPQGSFAWDVRLDGELLTIPLGSGHFAFASSDVAVVSPTGDGQLRGAGVGTARITATLGGVPVEGEQTLVVSSRLGPDVPAPTPPPRAAGDVISVFSDAYVNVSVDSFLGADSEVGPPAPSVVELAPGDDVRRYPLAGFFIVDTIGSPLDLRLMTHLHVDIWVDGPVDFFRVGLTDFGADGVFSPGVDDSTGRLRYDGTTTPVLTTGAWQSFDIPLTDFEAGGGFDEGPLLSREVIAQHAFAARLPGLGRTDIWFDNYYFYRAAAP